MEYNIYCDESCHLRRDNSNTMFLGGVYCPANAAYEYNRDIIELKASHGWNPHTELKWAQIAPSNVELFLDLIDYFFENDQIRFRGYIARGKDELNLEDDAEYNSWYYSIYYRMLEYILDRNVEHDFNIYIDIKDTIGYSTKHRSKEWKSLNGHYHRRIVQRAQLVRSDHIALLQLSDVLIGAMSYKNRRLQASASKLAVIERIEALSFEDLRSSVPYSHDKVNWYVWTPDTWR